MNSPGFLYEQRNLYKHLVFVFSKKLYCSFTKQMCSFTKHLVFVFSSICLTLASVILINATLSLLYWITSASWLTWALCNSTSNQTHFWTCMPWTLVIKLLNLELILAIFLQTCFNFVKSTQPFRNSKDLSFAIYFAHIIKQPISSYILWNYQLKCMKLPFTWQTSSISKCESRFNMLSMLHFDHVRYLDVCA